MPRLLMYKTDLPTTSRTQLTRILVDHMTWQYGNGIDWTENLTFCGAALLNSNEIDDDSTLTLQDLLQEFQARQNE